MQSELALRAAHDKLEKLSLTDGLTGIANRRRFDQTLQLEWQRAARNHQGLALLIIDIDFFKSLNDTFGHPYGDACLVRIAAALHSALPRASDLAARFGGEEFAAILPATDGDGALAVAHKMQEAIAAAAIVHAPSRGGLVTASIGLALSDAGQTPEQLLAAADQALYRAKQNGRNRVEA
ncbi:Phytochrome-like protein cph2 [compost metagenome]